MGAQDEDGLRGGEVGGGGGGLRMKTSSLATRIRYQTLSCPNQREMRASELPMTTSDKVRLLVLLILTQILTRIRLGY